MKILIVFFYFCVVFSYAAHSKDSKEYKFHVSFGELWNDNTRQIDDENFLGIGAEYFIAENWSGQFNYVNSKSFSEQDYKSYLLGSRYYFDGNKSTSLFLSGDVARASYTKQEESQLHLGIGINYKVNNNFYLTAEIKKVFSEKSFNQDAMSFLTLGYRFNQVRPNIANASSQIPAPELNVLTKDVVKKELVEKRPVEISSVSFYFPFDSSEPISVDNNKLNAFLSYALNNKKLIKVSGYTDATGSKNYNDLLSKRRANFIMNELKLEHAIDDDRISVFSYGTENPKGNNNTIEGRAINRRVTLSVE